MTLVALALALVTQGQDPETVVYRDEILNIAFSHAKDWRITKKDKRSVTFEIPFPNTDDKATLEIVKSAFRGEPEIWQTIQLRSNELSKNTVIRQWEQTVLEAPLLLTQVELNDKGRRMTRLTGLFYTKTQLKLLFNMQVPTTRFEDAQYTFNKSLETLRTIDGTDFATENPDTPVATGKPVPVEPLKTVYDGKGGNHPIKLKNEIPVTVGALKGTVRFPEGWAGEATATGIKLTSKRLSDPVTVDLGTPLDTEPVLALRVKAGASLAGFTKVSRRDDRDAGANAAGAFVSWVWRRGSTTDGSLQTLDAVVVNGDRYLYVHFAGKDPKRFDSDQSAITELLDRLTVETAS